MSTRSMRVRFALLYAAVLLAGLSLTAVSVLWQQERIGLRRVDRELDTLSATLANSVRDELRESQDPKRAASEAQNVIAVGTHSIAIVDARGDVLAARGNGFQLPAVRWSDTPDTATVRTPSGAWRVRHRQQGVGNDALTVLVATRLSDVEREQRESREAMLIGIPILFVLAAGGGVYLSAISVRPVAAALEVQRRFTADAAHELRTPVSVIRSAAEVTLTRDHREEAEYRDALTIIAGQTHSLGRLLQNMLMLARADAGVYPLRLVDLYVDDLVRECCQAVSAHAANGGVSLRLDDIPEASYRGDEDLLRQLVLNIVQNAIQHTPSGGSVRMALRLERDRIDVRVTNTGQPIPTADHARIFDRFVQLDASRRSEGAGLGLPIARWIARIHHGDVFVESSDRTQTTFCIVLRVAANG